MKLLPRIYGMRWEDKLDTKGVVYLVCDSISVLLSTFYLFNRNNYTIAILIPQRNTIPTCAY